MPPFLALLLTFAFVVFLFRRESKEDINVTGALWIPLIWLWIAGSRAVSQWLYACGIHGVGAVTVEEGSPLDALIYFTLIAFGCRVLVRRGVNLPEVVSRNKWIFFYLLYCFLSIIWSDVPFVAFKRWIKILGHPIMVLVVLSEPDPQAAMIRLFKRCAYVLIPFSITLIKYFVNVGREFNEWSGEARNSGVTTHKNLLGCDIMILGLFFFWHWLNVRQMEKSPAKREEMKLIGVFACMLGWLFLKAHSTTALVTLMVGALTMVVVGWRYVNKRFLGWYAVAAVLVLLVAQMSFGVVGESVEAMGKEATISGRMDLWKEVVGLNSNPLLGTGFESFWTGPRLAKIWAHHWWHPTEAHNGYLETYLNLGVIGLFLLLGTLIAAFRKICAELLTDFEYGRFRLGFLAAIVVYNWTEAAFKALSLVFFIFYIIVLNYPRRDSELPSPSLEIAPAEEEGQLVDDWGGQGQVRPS